MMTRTTITIPTDLYELLRLQAYQYKTSFSGIIQKKLTGNMKKSDKTGGIMKLAGTYRLKGKPFKRKDFYAAVAHRDMALGH